MTNVVFTWSIIHLQLLHKVQSSATNTGSCITRNISLQRSKRKLVGLVWTKIRVRTDSQDSRVCGLFGSQSGTIRIREELLSGNGSNATVDAMLNHVWGFDHDRFKFLSMNQYCTSHRSSSVTNLVYKLEHEPIYADFTKFTALLQTPNPTLQE